MTRKFIRIIGKSMAIAGGSLVCLGAMAADLNPIEAVMRLFLSGMAIGLAGAGLLQLTGSKIFY